MSASGAADEPDVADRVRGYFFWLLAAGIVGSLWFYADARSAAGRAQSFLPPPLDFPAPDPTGHSPWHWHLPAEDGPSPHEGLTATDPGLDSN